MASRECRAFSARPQSRTNRRPSPGFRPDAMFVRATGVGENAFSTRKTIDVGASDVTVELQMQAAPSVSGKVVFANPNAKARSALSVRLVSEDTNSTFTQPVNSEGSFTFKAAI